MLEVMKKMHIVSFFIVALIGAGAVSAALYKGVDAEGNVVYSDKPFAAAEKFTPPPISVMDSQAVGAKVEKGDKEEEPAEFKYTKFSITSPANYQTIRNEAFLNVSIELKPGLNAEESHGIWLLLDNKVVVKNSKSFSLQLGDVARGAHQIQAQVRDSAGKLLIRTKPVIVHVHRNSAR